MMHGIVRNLMAGLVVAFGAGQFASAQQNMFEPGWKLESEASALNFQSIKNMTKVETSGFAGFEGEIDPTGKATVTILLESVDTKIDLRNVRMRFLFFETFLHPEATITTQLTPEMLNDLEEKRRLSVSLPFNLNLHGISKDLQADVLVTLIDNNMVSVASKTPISIATSEFDLDGGVEKLEEAAGVDIVPSATVTFDFLFRRNAATAKAQTASAEQPEPQASAALEAAVFDAEACKGRFEILSRTGNIHFASGSARLQDESAPLLDTLVDVIKRCPGMVVEVGGHTDSVGGAAANQRLSERRAQSVARYIQGAGVEDARVQSVGYGETEPAFPNDTAKNRQKNRRIEFKVIDG